MSHDEMIAVIEHHKNGGKVEYMGRSEITWTPVSGNPLWNFAAHDYRVKPEPRSLWRVEHENGNSAGTFDDEYQAKIYCSSLSGAIIRQYKEVLP